MIFASNKSLGIEMRKSKRTVQYHRRRILHVLKIARLSRAPDTWDACPKCGESREVNTCGKCGYSCDHAGHKNKPCPQFRRTNTVELDEQRIASFRPRSLERRAEPWRNYREYSEATRKPQHRSTSHASPSNEGGKQEVLVAKPALVAPAAESHRSPQRTLRRLTPREGPKLVNEMRRLMLGVTKVSGEGLPLRSNQSGWDMSPSDPRYRAPMPQDEALASACMNLGIPYDSAREHLKLCRFSENEKPEGP